MSVSQCSSLDNNTPKEHADQRASSLNSVSKVKKTNACATSQEPPIPLGMITSRITQDVNSSVDPVNNQEQVLKIQLISQDAKLPVRGSDLAIGYDLFATSDHIIQPGKRVLVSTGIACAFPSGTYGRIAPRSGLSIKHCIDLGAGVINA